jgi:hypothetical protein
MRILQTNKRPRTTLCWNGTKKTWCVHYIWPQLKRLRVSIWSHLITGINWTSCKKREDRNGGNMGYCYRMGLPSYVCWFIIPSKYSYVRLRHRLQFHHPSAPTTSWRDDVGPETLRALNNNGLNLNHINIYIYICIYIYTYVYMYIIYVYVNVHVYVYIPILGSEIPSHLMMIMIYNDHHVSFDFGYNIWIQPQKKTI